METRLLIVSPQQPYYWNSPTQPNQNYTKSAESTEYGVSLYDS